MNVPTSSAADRVYRWLLRALPEDFRGDFGDEMELVFQDQRRDLHGEGDALRLLRIWWEAIAGIFQTAPREHFAILRQEAGHAFEMLAKQPGNSLLAVLTLALGIGAATAVFAAVYSVLLQPLPVFRGDQLLIVHQRAPKSKIPEMGFSTREIADYRQRNHSFVDMAEHHSMVFTLLDSRDTERVRTGVVSANYFDLFGVKPVLGRGFQPADESHEAHPVLLMTHEYWRKRGSDPNIAGKNVRLNDREHTVIGVLPPLPHDSTADDVYMPVGSCPFRMAPAFVNNREARMMDLAGRLRPGVTIDDARRDLAAIAAQLQKEHPAVYPAERGYMAWPEKVQDQLTRRSRPMLLLLAGAAGLLLIIACANVANLTLAGMLRRRRELEIRLALGAAPHRLLRQLITESLVIGLLAAGVGLGFASLVTPRLAEFLSPLTPRAQEISIGEPAIAFAFTVALLSSLAFGSMAVLSLRTGTGSILRERAPRTQHGMGRSRLRNGLVICQVAFSFVLLIGAGLLARSFVNLYRSDPGFSRQSVVAASLHFDWTRYVTEQQRREGSLRLLAKIREQPGVTTAALASNFPLNPEAIANGIGMSSIQAVGQEDETAVAIRAVTSDYFRTLDIPIVEGRSFSAVEDRQAASVAIVSKALARRLWGVESPIGQRVLIGDQQFEATVAGVAGDVQELGPARGVQDEIYIPLPLQPEIGAVLLRLSESVDDPASLVRRAVRELDSSTAVTGVETLSHARGDSMWLNKRSAELLGVFAMLSLVIAIGGVAGILTLLAGQRFHEIAIRMALGARPIRVLGLIAGQGMKPVLIGIAMGWAGSFGLTRVLQGLLFSVTPTDPPTYFAISFLLTGAALIACYIPAMGAARIDPQTALRAE